MEGEPNTSRHEQLDEDFMGDAGRTVDSDDSDVDFEISDDEQDFPDISLIDESMPVFDWKTDDFIPKINTFDCVSSGSNIENVGTREVDFFKLFMSNTLMSYICDETNKQYQYVKSNCNELSWRLKQWTDTTIEDL